MKRFFILINLMVMIVFVNAQNLKRIDSLNKVLSKTNDPSLQIKILSEFTNEYHLVDIRKSDSVMKLIYAKAEFSRNRELIIDAYLIDAVRNLRFGGIGKKYNEVAIQSAEKAVEIAKTNNLKEKEVGAQLILARAYRSNNQIDKAIK